MNFSLDIGYSTSYNVRMNIIEKAAIFATAAHAAVGQVRKYTGDPYIVHPQEVVNILSEVCDDETALATAWLHDVVEDTHITLDIIEDCFGSLVRDYVMLLTDTKYGKNRAERKATDRARLRHAPADVQSIKVADLISNSASIVDHDEKFAKVYIQEKRELLNVLVKAHPLLLQRAWAIIVEAERKLQ